LSRHISAPHFYSSRSRTCASPPGLLDMGEDEPGDWSTVKRKFLLLKMSFTCHFMYFCKFFLKCEYIYISVYQNTLSETTLSTFALHL